MTWLNIPDSEKNQKRLNIDIVKFTYDGAPYNVSRLSSGTHAFNKGYCPLLIPNKSIICGTDFVTTVSGVSNGVTIHGFNLASFDTANYLYLFDYSFGYYGHSANEENGYYVQFSRTSNISSFLNCFNVNALPAQSRTIGYYSPTTGPLYSTNFFVSSGVTDYTNNLTNAEYTRGNIIWSESPTSIYFLNSGAGAIIVRPELASTTAQYPTGHKISNVEIVIKRIPK